MNTKLEYHLPVFQILERNGKNLQNIVEIMKMVTVEHILLRNYREQHLSWTVYFSAENSRNKIYPLQNRLHYHGVRVYLPLFGSSSSFGTGLRHFLMLEVLSGHCAQFNPVAQYVPVELSSSVHVPPAAISIVAEIVQISLVIY